MISTSKSSTVEHGLVEHVTHVVHLERLDCGLHRLELDDEHPAADEVMEHLRLGALAVPPRACRRS